ncbi:hypothetical protein [Halococcoides cellulosivorans]|nr:hypothetical protein [Halococcoides cellulosivorans]
MASDASNEEVESVEEVLLDQGVLQETPDGTDFELTDRADAAVRGELDAIDDLDDALDRARPWLGVDPDLIRFERDGDAVTLYFKERNIGAYPSEAAILADVAIAAVLLDWVDGWEEFETRRRGEIVSGVRLFLDVCPACDEAVTFDSKTVESCCGTYDVAALVCRNCGARLYESGPIEASE